MFYTAKNNKKQPIKKMWRDTLALLVIFGDTVRPVPSFPPP